MHKIRTLEQVEADGLWASAANSGHPKSTLSLWIKKGLLKEGDDYLAEVVALQLSDGQRPCKCVRFFRRDALERLKREKPSFSELAKARWRRRGFRAKTSQGMKDAWQRNGRKARAAAKRKAWWRNPVNRASAAKTAKARTAGSEQLVERKTVLLCLRRACKYLNVCDRTLIAWSDTEDRHGSCPFLPGRAALNPETRNGRLYWTQDQLKEVKRRRSKFRRVSAARGTYTPEQTSEMTGIALSTLKSRKRREALGLRTTVVEVLVVYERTAKSEADKGDTIGGKRQWSRIAEMVVFTKDSVDRYVRERPPAANTAGAKTPREVAEILQVGLTTVYYWMNEGLLDGEPEIAERATGYPRMPFWITGCSVRVAAKALRQAGGNVREAGQLLRQARKPAEGQRRVPQVIGASEPIAGAAHNQAAAGATQGELSRMAPWPVEPVTTPDNPVWARLHPDDIRELRAPAGTNDDGHGDDVTLSASKRKQKYCYEQYLNLDKKLSIILREAKKVFKDKAPKSTADVITYAKRWAEHIGKELPRRN
jgi:hypothetical protein